jgi:hypothetical protein
MVRALRDGRRVRESCLLHGLRGRAREVFSDCCIQHIVHHYSQGDEAVGGLQHLPTQRL